MLSLASVASLNELMVTEVDEEESGHFAGGEDRRPPFRSMTRKTAASAGEHVSSPQPDQIKNNIDNRIPLRREGRPAEVAEIIAMLVRNDLMTGENIVADGRLTMRIA